MENIRTRKGFTLIEMTIVLFIISLLILIVIPNLSHARNYAQTVHRHAMVSLVQSQVDNYLNDHPGDKNIDTSELVRGGYLTNGQETKATNEGIKINGTKVEVSNNS